MNEMHRYAERVKRFTIWGKIFLPFSSMRFYPPQFIVRNPVIEGVKAAFYHDYEVAVIVFNLKNLKELAEQLGKFRYNQFMEALRKSFRSSIERELSHDEVISLHDFSGDGFTLLIKLEDDLQFLPEIDSTIRKIVDDVEQNLYLQFAPLIPQFESGYMFVEKRHDSVDAAVAKAYKQAVMMAEKRVQSEYNEMMFAMSRIIFQKDIKLLAQPIMDVSTNQIYAWEMLSRGPEGTIFESPLSLFSVARQTGMLYELEMIVFEKAFQLIKATECKQEIFINCTPLTLGNMSFIHDLQKLMERYKGISPRQITFEITERDSIEEIIDFIHNIKKLRFMGFKIAVDDTGAGYASLNTISEVLPDIIKIDRSVIENIDKNSVKESMLKGLLLVAKEAGSLVVAEGIENEEEASVLTRNNVDLAQGYYYARPGLLV
ncbi:MAG TPA: EAL domain-containing protein [Bacillales bacterium]|nr:EAL domain-containing protein [Bacillales bacterium]